MSNPEDNNGGGYRCPPKHSQWKKGESGNPKRGPTKKTKTLAQLVEAAFAKKITVVENGIKRKCTVFEIIVTQLWIKAAAGNARALRVYNKYQQYAMEAPQYYVATKEQQKEAAERYARTLRGKK